MLSSTCTVHIHLLGVNFFFINIMKYFEGKKDFRVFINIGNITFYTLCQIDANFSQYRLSFGELFKQAFQWILIRESFGL